MNFSNRIKDYQLSKQNLVVPQDVQSLLTIDGISKLKNDF